MNELVFKSEKGNVVTTSLLVAEKFGKRHSDVLRAIRELECSPEFHQRNFAPMFYLNDIGNGAKRNDPYALMTRDGFSFLVMGFTGEMAAKFKEDFINAFNKMEQSLNAQLPQDYLSALKALVVSEEAKQLAESQVKELAPKAEVYDQISNADNLMTLNDAAKALGKGRNKLMEYLRNVMILRKNNTPYQEFINAGYFVVKVKPFMRGDENRDYMQTFVTGKGLTWLSKRLSVIKPAIDY